MSSREASWGATSRGLAGSWTVFWLAFVAFTAVAVSWALASPIFSVPDESAHVIKAIGQVHGEVVGHREAGVRHLVVDLPQQFSFSSQTMCFVYHSEVPASCGIEVGDPRGATEAASWVSTYNPIYYYLVGWPSLFLGGPAGIYAMRIASAILGGLLFAAAFQAATASRRAWWLPAGLGFLALPMVGYLNGSVNPNGVEIVSAVALTAGLLGLLGTFDPARFEPSALRRGHLWAIVTVAAILLANARALGPLWVVVIVALCFVACGWQSVRGLFVTARSYIWLAIIAAGGLFSIGWTLAGGSLSGQAEKADAPLVDAGFLQGATYMVRATPRFAVEALGYFGWFDAPLPGYAFWFAVAALAVLAVLALATARRREFVVLVIAVGVAALLPVLVQASSVHQTGIIWQGRYGLFLYLSVILLFAWVLSRGGGDRIAFLSVRLTWTIGALLWIFGALAFLLTLRRYVIGNAEPIGQMLKDPQWQPPLGWPVLLALFLIASAAFVVLVGAAAQRLARSDASIRELTTT
ncbi:hypothetical protein LLS1_26990 [Leifsonia sp. LS1]|uniref:DUF2142 domain-containing protein n=1 Tax=Leifsonia sp. LS1 TaxID=2828483 RepID=UPI001CFC4CD6|nr:DUF2142 domain-containing protein [Leifsonia sp. LS1]GIT81030.1 hypothetical protein LLS1_26990 [Leifsonia sp. LS1]